jgi:hypothetical protein
MNTNDLYSDIEIVISRYNEKLEWLNEPHFNDFHYTVYNKGVNRDFIKKNVTQIIDLPNVGRCDHTYIYHIVNNYNNLSTITVFFPGSIDSMEHKKNNAIRILENIKKYKNAIFLGSYVDDVKKHFENFVLDEWSCSDPKNMILNPEKKLCQALIRPFGKWFQFHFGNIKVTYYCIHGILSVHKLDIIKHPITRYKKILAGVERHSNPEVGHYIERAWGAIFYPFIHTTII